MDLDQDLGSDLRIAVLTAIDVLSTALASVRYAGKKAITAKDSDGDWPTSCPRGLKE
jgi:uncharacterized membrane protein YfbV (UPF0208 family)